MTRVHVGIEIGNSGDNVDAAVDDVVHGHAMVGEAWDDLTEDHAQRTMDGKMASIAAG